MHKLKISLEQNQYKSLLEVVAFSAIQCRSKLSIGTYIASVALIEKMQKRVSAMHVMNGLVSSQFSLFPFEWELILSLIKNGNCKISNYDKISCAEIFEQLQRLEFELS